MEELTRLVQKVADRTLYSVNIINRKGIDHTQKVKWSSNSEPAKAKHVYKRMRYLFNNDIGNVPKRLEFLNAKKKYKRAIKRFKQQIKTNKLNKLATMESHSPKQFWKEVKSMIGGKRWTEQTIEPVDWIEHFTSLLYCAS